ncbi:MAG TPA: hypothetical protein VGM56_21845 [Byssovorax sp.]
MTSRLEPAPGERVVFTSERVGPRAARVATGPALIAFGAAIVASAALVTTSAPALALLPPAAFAALMITARRLAAASVFSGTDRRGVAERLLCAPLEIDPGRIARAELRDDVFFARSSRSGDAPAGPVFVGPSALVGLRSPLAGPPLYLALSVAGQAQPADDVERRMIELARRATCGPAVVVQRDGAALRVEGDALVFDGPGGRVSFALDPLDAERARRFTRTATAYRG